jgi:hypothetical protein
MDVVYFLKERTNFIRFYYDQGPRYMEDHRTAADLH